MNLLALDLSLTATGWAMSLDEHGVEKTAGTFRGVERLAEYHYWLTAMLTYNPALVALEGYAYGRPNAMASIAEWGGVARLTIDQAGIPFVEIPPATLKKYATGKGNATKADMRMALYKRATIDLADDNEVDAIWLYAATRHALGDPLWEMPQVNVAALGKVTWPELTK